MAMAVPDMDPADGAAAWAAQRSAPLAHQAVKTQNPTPQSRTIFLVIKFGFARRCSRVKILKDSIALGRASVEESLCKITSAQMSDRLNITDASAYLELSPATLARRRLDGTGPEFISLSPNNRTIRYTRESLDKFLSDRTYNSRRTTMPEREITASRWEASVRLLMLNPAPCSSDAEQTGPGLFLRGRLIWLSGLVEINHPKMFVEFGKVKHLFTDRDVLHVLCSSELSPEVQAILTRAAVLNRASAKFYASESDPAWVAAYAKKCWE